MPCYLNDVKSIGFRLTNLCNLNCAFCGQANQIKNEKHSKENKHYLWLNELKDIVNQVISYKPQVYLWGGEPLVYPDLLNFIQYLRKYHLNIFITTNGVLLDKFVESFINHKVTQLTISLEGFKEDHEKIRGVDGIYDRIIDNMLEINRLKKKFEKVFPIIDINLVITDRNYYYLNDFCEHLIKFKSIRKIRLQLPMFFRKPACMEFNKHTCDIFSCKKVNPSWSYFTYQYESIDIPILENQLKRALQKKNVLMFPKQANVRQWFEQPEIRFKHHCHTANYRINVEPNGDLIACTDFPETVYGNALRKPIKELYNNACINAHRKSIQKNDMKLCARCSHLYIY